MSSNIEQVQDRFGLFRNVPRTIRRAVERRLQTLENDPDAFDREALLCHGRLKRLYALLHIQSGERAKATLFEQLPADSPRAALRELAGLREYPEAAAELIREHCLPYLLVESALGQISEPVAVALIETMEGDELLVRLPLLSRRELLRGAPLAALRLRLERMADDPSQRYPYQKIESVVRQANLDKQTTEAAFRLVGLERERVELTGDTALVIDASLSMPREGNSLELAASVAWRIDQALAASAQLWVYLTGESAQQAPTERSVQMDQWRATLSALSFDRAGTSLGAAVELMLQGGRHPARIVVVTDGYENRPPRLASTLRRFRSATGRRPAVCLVQPGGSSLQLGADLRSEQIPFQVFAVDQHRFGLRALLAALAADAQEDWVAQILAMPDED